MPTNCIIGTNQVPRLHPDIISPPNKYWLPAIIYPVKLTKAIKIHTPPPQPHRNRIWPHYLAAEYTGIHTKLNLSSDFIVYVLSDGYYACSDCNTQVWFDKDYQLHREDGPALDLATKDNWPLQTAWLDVYNIHNRECSIWYIHGQKMTKRGNYLFSKDGIIVLKVKE